MASSNDHGAFSPSQVTFGSIMSGVPDADHRRCGTATTPVDLVTDPLGVVDARAHWRPAGGVLLLAIVALIGAWMFVSPPSNISVVVAARDLGPGHVVTPGDIRIVDVGGAHGYRSVPATQRELLIGRAARAFIPEGSLIHPDLVVARGSAVPTGKVVLGAELAGGAVPVAGLRSGDRVVVLAASPGRSGASRLGVAEVWAVEVVPSTSPPGRMWVALLVDAARQTAVAQAAAAGHLRLGLVAS